MLYHILKFTCLGRFCKNTGKIQLTKLHLITPLDVSETTTRFPYRHKILKKYCCKNR